MAARGRALQRHLQTLAGEFEKGARSFDPGMVLKTGATLVRQWRERTHTVLVREDGFEYEGQRYRSLGGITLESLEIQTDGDIDLRGFLGIDPAVPPGYET